VGDGAGFEGEWGDGLRKFARLCNPVVALALPPSTGLRVECSKSLRAAITPKYFAASLINVSTCLTILHTTLIFIIPATKYILHSWFNSEMPCAAEA